MRRYQNFIPVRFILIVLISLALTGCISLADDITPPPDQASPERLAPTSPPTLEPTREIPATVESQSEDNSQDGIVNVYILDNTEGLLLEESPAVQLEGYDQFEQVFVESLPISPEGFVQFSGVPFPEGRVYFASIIYGGAIYRSQIVLIEPEQTSLDLQVEIFNTTTDQAGLIIDRVHVLIDFTQPDIAEIVEIYILSNLGDATIVPEAPGEISVEFPLPAGAVGIGFEDGNLGERYLKTDGGFGDTVSIPPGSGIYPVSVYYSLPYEKNRLDFEQKFNYPVGAVVIMLPAGDVIVKGSTLEDMGVQSIPSGEVQIYSGQAVARDQVLQFRISGKPALDTPQGEMPISSSPQFDSESLIIYGGGGLGLILLITGVWLFLRNRRQENESPDGSEVSEKSQEELLDSIIALDDLFAMGEIPEKAYHLKRTQLKDEFKSISGFSD